MSLPPELGSAERSLSAEAALAMTHECELTVVMPVYNEQDALPACLRSWVEVLEREGIDYDLLVIDDGSRDRSGAVLTELAAHPRIRAVSKENEGHGPTIIRGYRDAVRRAEWVFQVDSDDEIPASAFPELWRRRQGHDAVFGVRTGRDQSIGRKLISGVARQSTQVLYGSRLADVNVPFRLVRGDVLAPIIDRIPGDTFAPNVVISGALARSGADIVEVPVPHRERATGTVSIVGWKALRAAARSFVQTLRLARRFR